MQKKKQALAEFLADLEEIHKAYARSAYQDSTVSNTSIADESTKNNAEIDAGDTAFEYDAETDTLLCLMLQAHKTAANAIGEVHDSSDTTTVTPTRTRRNGDATVFKARLSYKSAESNYKQKQMLSTQTNGNEAEIRSKTSASEKSIAFLGCAVKIKKPRSWKRRFHPQRVKVQRFCSRLSCSQRI